MLPRVLVCIMFMSIPTSIGTCGTITHEMRGSKANGKTPSLIGSIFPLGVDILATTRIAPKWAHAPGA